MKLKVKRTFIVIAIFLPVEYVNPEVITIPMQDKLLNV
jgi:hypothetical protein